MGKGMHMTSWVLLGIGGLNWGLVGLFGFDLVATIFGDGSIISRIIYILVGLSAVMALFSMNKMKEMKGGKM